MPVIEYSNLLYVYDDISKIIDWKFRSHLPTPPVDVAMLIRPTKRPESEVKFETGT